MKTYRINGKEIFLLSGNSDYWRKKYGLEEIVETINSLIEALSDKEEEYHNGKEGEIKIVGMEKEKYCDHNWLEWGTKGKMMCYKCATLSDKSDKEETVVDPTLLGKAKWTILEGDTVYSYDLEKEEPKEEECTTERETGGHYYVNDKKVCCGEPKQSTSLKEEIGTLIQEISDWRLNRTGGLVEADKILYLLQSLACENCKHKFGYEDKN